MRYLNKILSGAIAVTLSACGSGSSSSSTSTNSGGWTWMGGSNQAGAYGVYGTKGVASSSNTPGARYIAVSWVGNDGNLWLFSGSGNAASGSSGNLNDLWKYNPTKKEWTWVGGSNTTNAYGVYGIQGVPDKNNIPGARLGAVSFKDLTGNLWLFGGFGNAEVGIPGALNDLWKYNPASNEWTWVSGARTTNESGVYGTQGVPSNSNIPGARLGQVGWTDSSGNLWLFGGAKDIITAIVHNDLWKYNPTTNQWTWVSGSSSVNQPGVYGVQGISTPTNVPGSRLDSVSWIDKTTGNLWLFGGSGLDANGNHGNLNDLWQYNPNTEQWTWMSGSNLIGNSTYGVYGSLGVATQNTIPGAREHRVPIAWSDSHGNLWMFGGDGYGASTTGILNDLWSYTTTTNEWTWMGGSTESNAFGVYGSIGISSISNIPGARMDAVGWVDESSNLWLFGGSGNGLTTNGNLNDLWVMWSQ